MIKLKEIYKQIWSYLAAKKAMIPVLIMVMVMLLGTVSFAWFRNIMRVTGVVANTGNFDYQFISFFRQGSDGEFQDGFAFSTKPQAGFEVIDSSENVHVTSGATTLQVSSEGYGEVYYLVRKLSNSIDLDVSISLDAQLEKLDAFETPNLSETITISADEINGAIENIGGFWYSVADVTGQISSNASLQQLKDTVLAQEFHDARNDNFSEIRREIHTKTMEANGDEYWCFRLRYGLKENVANAYIGNSLPIYASICVAQKGGLPEQETKNTFYASTEAQLRQHLLNYRPGDNIIIQGHIVYDGDLVINRPLNLTISSGSLTVKGNMHFNYLGGNLQYSDSTSIEFNLHLSGGNLRVVKMDNVDAGGNLYVNIPNASMEIVGRNQSGIGEADIYVDERIIFNADYVEIADDEDALASPQDLGMILSNVRICEPDESLKAVNLSQCTKLTVDYSTHLGAVTVRNSKDSNENAIRVYILNYGEIQTINLKNMQHHYDTTRYPEPRIVIDNYGTIVNPIILPSWSAKYESGVVGNIGVSNTRIIHRQGASFMSVDPQSNCPFTSDGSRGENDHIEYVDRATLIEKDYGKDPEGAHITIHYMEAENILGKGVETSIQRLIEYYSTLGVSSPYRILTPDNILSVKIVCHVDYKMTEADYAYIRENMPALEALDLSEAKSVNSKVPDNAFQGLSNLSKIDMPVYDEEWGANLFVDTKVDEITFPYRLQHIDSQTLTGIQFLHLRDKAQMLIDCVPELFIYLSQVGETRPSGDTSPVPYHTTPQVYLICGDEPTRLALISYLEQVYSARYQNGAANYHFKDKESGTPVKKELQKLTTIFVGQNVERVGKYLAELNRSSKTCRILTYLGTAENTVFSAATEAAGYQYPATDEGVYYSFNFKYFSVGNELYTVVEYDDFAFFNKSLLGMSGDTLQFHESLISIGDGAFFDAHLPAKVDLGGCKTLGHAALMASGKNMQGVSYLIGKNVETLGYYSCWFQKSVTLINLPSARWDYGIVFGTDEYAAAVYICPTVRAADAVPKAQNVNGMLYDPTKTQGVNITVFLHTENLPDDFDVSDVTPFAPSAIYRLIMPDRYTDVTTSAYKTNRRMILYHQNPGEVGLMKWDGTDVSDRERYKYEIGDLVYGLNSDGTAYTLLCQMVSRVSKDFKGEDLVIPAYVDAEGRSTTTINGYAFGYLQIYNIGTLTFADSYTTISAEAFRSGGNGTREKRFVYLDLNNVESLGANAFSNNPTLVSVVGKNVKSVGASCFESCSSLRVASLPNATFGVNSYIFRYCSNLEIAAIGPQYKATHVFDGCTKLHTAYINLTNTNSTKREYLILDGGSHYSAATKFDPEFTLISIGEEMTWETSLNSPHNPNLGDVTPYNQIVLDCDSLDDLIFADWDSNALTGTLNLSISSGTTYSYTYSIAQPKYLFSKNADGKLTIQQFFAAEDEVIQGDVFRVPDTLYYTGNNITDPIFSNQTKEYSTVNQTGFTATNLRVSEIAANIYKNRIMVNQVYFPQGLTLVGASAFENCTLGEVNIVGSGLVVGNGAFRNSILASINLENVVNVGAEAFRGVHNVDETGSYTPLTTISLGSQLTFIGDRAFEEAYTQEIKTTHPKQTKLELRFGENAFASVKNTVEKAVDVDLGYAKVYFGKNSFAGTDLNNLHAPCMVEVSEGAFQGSSILGTIDFSKGYTDSNGNGPVIYPGGFSDGELGIILLGPNTLVKGDYNSKTGVYPIPLKTLNILSAFSNCNIKELYFSKEDAISPEACAFYKCSFELIDFGNMTTLGADRTGAAGVEYSTTNDTSHQLLGANNMVTANLQYTQHVFVNCSSLGDVYFNNIENLGYLNVHLSSSGSLNTSAAKTKMTICGQESLKNLQARSFYIMDITGDITVRSALSSSGFMASCTLRGDLIVESGASVGSAGVQSSTITGSVHYLSGAKTTSEGIRDCTIKQDLWLNDNITIGSTWSFNRTSVNGTVYVGNISTSTFIFGDGMGNYPNNRYKTLNKVKFLDSCTTVPTKFAMAMNIGEIDFNKVTTISDYAFANSVIGSVRNMENVQVIGKCAFGNRADFMTVSAGSTPDKPTSIGSGLSLSNATSIGEGAFYNLTFAQQVNLSKVATINANAFKQCTFENGITFGDAKATIKGQAFNQAKFMNGLQLGNVAAIEANAFQNAVITGDLVFGTVVSGIVTGGVKAIGASAFESVTVTGNIHFGNVTSIGQNAFKGANINTPLTFNKDVEIGEYAFYEFSTTSVEFKGSPTIRSNAFGNSTISEQLIFHQGGVIEPDAFVNGHYGTVKLGSVTRIGGISTSVIKHDGNARKQYVPVEDQHGAFLGATISALYFENAAAPEYYAFAFCPEIGYMHLGSLTTLGQNITDDNYNYSAFHGIQRIGKLNLGTVSYFGSGTLAKLTIGELEPVTTAFTTTWRSWATLTFESDVIFNAPVTLSSFAFYGETNGMMHFKSVYFNQGLNVDYNSTGQQKWTIDGDLYISHFINTKGPQDSTDTSYDNRALLSSGSKVTGKLIVKSGDLNARFSGTTFGSVDLSGVKNIYGGNVAKSIYGNFVNCTFLDSSIRMDNVKTLGKWAFTNCTFKNGSGSIYLDKATSVADGAILGFQNLALVSMNQLTSVGQVLQNLTFAENGTVMLNNAKTIQDGAFANLSNLTQVLMPMVQHVGAGAFSGCTSLESVNLPNVESFGAAPFDGCSALQVVSIGDKLTDWGNGTFTGTQIQSVLFRTPITLNAGNSSVATPTGSIALPSGAYLTVPEVDYAAYQTLFQNTPSLLLWGSVSKSQVQMVELLLTSANGVQYVAERVENNLIEIVDIRDFASNAIGSFEFASVLSDSNGTEYTVISVSSSAMRRIPKEITTVVLPATLEYINFTSRDLHSDLASFSISPSALYFETIDGVLYTEGGKMLLAYPSAMRGNSGTVTIPETVEYIASYAFAGNTGIVEVIIPGVVTLGDGVFANCNSLKTIRFTNDVASKFSGTGTITGCYQLQRIVVTPQAYDGFVRSITADLSVRRKLTTQ